MHTQPLNARSRVRENAHTTHVRVTSPVLWREQTASHRSRSAGHAPPPQHTRTQASHTRMHGAQRPMKNARVCCCGCGRLCRCQAASAATARRALGNRLCAHPRLPGYGCCMPGCGALRDGAHQDTALAISLVVVAVDLGRAASSIVRGNVRAGSHALHVRVLMSDVQHARKHRAAPGGRP